MKDTTERIIVVQEIPLVLLRVEVGNFTFQVKCIFDIIYFAVNRKFVPMCFLEGPKSRTGLAAEIEVYYLTEDFSFTYWCEARPAPTVTFDLKGLDDVLQTSESTFSSSGIRDKLTKNSVERRWNTSSSEETRKMANGKDIKVTCCNWVGCETSTIILNITCKE